MFFTSKALFGALLALAAIAAPAQALDLTNVAFIRVVDAPASIPVGHAEFCKARPAECRRNDSVVSAMPLDEARWSELLQINANVNGNVTPVSDMDLYQVDEFWTYPNGYGDCEDIALAKRHDLINAGWPVSTLLMAIVKQADGDGHAVLIVRTDRGDLVLDNRDGAVRLWSDTPYHYVKRQSRANAGQWVDMLDSRQIAVATTAGIN
ncbi:transglutaminase-like cysteine peptidase [Devosia sp. A8/3-2]|nr:transglutaminase-like cysteine peptidase [Devosia sp. A8/3-2]